AARHHDVEVAHHRLAIPAGELDVVESSLVHHEPPVARTGPVGFAVVHREGGAHACPGRARALPPHRRRYGGPPPAPRPARMTMAVNANRQFSASSTVTATARRISETAGDTIAICNSPVVVSTSPVRRDRMPPVFMSHTLGSGRRSKRWNSDRRSDSITRTFSRRWR